MTRYFINFMFETNFRLSLFAFGGDTCRSQQQGHDAHAHHYHHITHQDLSSFNVSHYISHFSFGKCLIPKTQTWSLNNTYVYSAHGLVCAFLQVLIFPGGQLPLIGPHFPSQVHNPATFTLSLSLSYIQNDITRATERERRE